MSTSYNLFMKILNKKGSTELTTFTMSVVTVGVVIAVALIVLSSMTDAVANCNTGFAFNETRNSCMNLTNTSTVRDLTVRNGNATETLGVFGVKLSGVASWVGILITVFCTSLILGYFYFKGQE